MYDEQLFLIQSLTLSGAADASTSYLNSAWIPAWRDARCRWGKGCATPWTRCAPERMMSNHSSFNPTPTGAADASTSYLTLCPLASNPCTVLAPFFSCTAAAAESATQRKPASVLARMTNAYERACQCGTWECCAALAAGGPTHTSALGTGFGARGCARGARCGLAGV